MYSKRHYILVFVWFLILVFSITPVESKMRKLTEHGIFKNRPRSAVISNLHKIRKKRSKFKNLDKFSLNSILKIHPFDLSKNKDSKDNEYFGKMAKTTLITEIPVKNENACKNVNCKFENKTLLNLEKSIDHLEDFKDQDNNLTHVRVKRDKKSSRFQSNYLEDLAASFPKSEHELEEEERLASLASNKIEDDRLFKRSSHSDNEENNLHELCRLKLNQNQENPQHKKYSRVQRINIYSDLDGVELQRRRYNKAKQYHQMSPMEDGSKDDNIYDNQHNMKNSDDNNLENQRNVKNVASDKQKISDKLQSDIGFTQPEHKREVSLKEEIKSINKIHSGEESNIKTGAIEDAFMRFPSKAVRESSLLREKRKMKKSDKKKLKKKKHMKNNTKKRKAKDKKKPKKNSKHSKKHKKPD